MNYAEMSDAEIAEAVVKTIILEHGEYWTPCASGTCAVIVNEVRGTVRTFNPCNNPDDMWPLIVENEISILVGKERSAFAFHKVNRDAEDRPRGYDFSFSCKNALRAAAIVYLMMKEAGK